MDATAYLITAIVTLAGVIGVLWVTLLKLNKTMRDDAKENLLKITTALTENARSNEHLANAIDDLKLVVVNRKK